MRRESLQRGALAVVGLCLCLAGYEAIAWHNARGRMLCVTARTGTGEGGGAQISLPNPRPHGGGVLDDAKGNRIASHDVSFALRAVVHSGFLVSVRFEAVDRQGRSPARTADSSLVFFPYDREKTCSLDDGVHVAGRFVRN